MLIVLIGKTASGKSTLQDMLVNEGYEKIVTYTTRPKRRGEKDGVDYNYITQQEFMDKVEAGFFAEYNVFHTEKGDWYYGSAIEDYDCKDKEKVIILTPSGLTNIREQGFDVFSIYIYSNQATIEERLIARKDNKSEAARRMAADNVDFANAQNIVNKIVYNNKGSDLKDVLDKIKKLVRNKRNER